MPYDWVEPDVVVNHKNVVIYNVYPDDMKQSPVLEYRYGYDLACDEETDSFDIRKLPNYKSDLTHEEILIEAIDLGYITPDGLSINKTGNEPDD